MTEIKVPATSANLGPGYDTFGLALSLYNNFRINRRNDKKIKVKIFDKNKNKEIKIKNEDNLVVKAYKKYFDFINLELIGADIVEEMHTPLARGLGSSSSAIVGGLAAAAVISGKLISEKNLIQLAVALEKHPDNVTPALVGGLTINYNCNNSYDYYKIKIDESLNFILLVPDFELKTEDLRNVLPQKIDYSKAINNLSRVSLLTTAFIKKDYQLLKIAMEDQMHQPFRKKLIKDFDKVINNAYNNGAYGAALSGAGPTIIAITEDKAEKIAENMKKIFNDNSIETNTFIVKACNENLYQNLKEEIL